MSLQMIDNIDIWVDGIPEGWSLVKLKHVVTKLSRPTSNSDEVLVCTNKGQVSPRGENSSGLISLTENGYQGVQPGDLLIHGMDTWHGAIAVSNLAGKCTSVVHVCDSIEEKRFISYYLRALSFRRVYKAFSNGVRQNTSDFRSWSKIGIIPVIIPSLEEQRRIANFLDDKCAEIDNAIAAAEASIEDCKSYQICLIRKLIESVSAPYVKLNYLISLCSGSALTKENMGYEGEVPVYGGGDIKGYTNKPNCSAGTLIISRQGATCGTTRLIDKAFWATEHAMIVTIKNPQVSTIWLLYALSNLDLGSLSMTAAQPGISQEKVFSQRIPLPSLEEQKRITNYLDAKCAEIAKAIEAKRSIIDDLKAYKQSLIYETVTGKRKV